MLYNIQSQDMFTIQLLLFASPQGKSKHSRVSLRDELVFSVFFFCITYCLNEFHWKTVDSQCLHRYLVSYVVWGCESLSHFVLCFEQMYQCDGLCSLLFDSHCSVLTESRKSLMIGQKLTPEALELSCHKPRTLFGFLFLNFLLFLVTFLHHKIKQNLICCQSQWVIWTERRPLFFFA